MTHAILLRDYLLDKSHEGEGALTSALRKFLRGMWKDPGGTLSPKELFATVCERFLSILYVLNKLVHQDSEAIISRILMSF